MSVDQLVRHREQPQPAISGTIQVDVDELWVYYESIGVEAPANASMPVYEHGIPRLLDLFQRHRIRATFFVCGKDLVTQAEVVAEIARQGHEVANHSTQHRPGFARLTLAEKRADIGATHDAITEATGQAPVGFKSPGFSFHPDQLVVLEELGYLYDSSLLPTPYAPLLRSLQRALSSGRVDPTQYGSVSHGLAPLRPYRPDLTAPYRPRPDGDGCVFPGDGPGLWEVPVTTMPGVRVPMHSTFVLSAGRALFDLGIGLVKARRIPVNYLLHAADVIDPTSDPALASYRFLNMHWADKQPLIEHMLERLRSTFHLVPTRDLVRKVVP